MKRNRMIVAGLVAVPCVVALLWFYVYTINHRIATERSYVSQINILTAQRDSYRNIVKQRKGIDSDCSRDYNDCLVDLSELIMEHSTCQK